MYSSSLNKEITQFMNGFDQIQKGMEEEELDDGNDMDDEEEEEEEEENEYYPSHMDDRNTLPSPVGSSDAPDRLGTASKGRPVSGDPTMRRSVAFSKDGDGSYSQSSRPP